MWHEIVQINFTPPDCLSLQTVEQKCLFSLNGNVELVYVSITLDLWEDFLSVIVSERKTSNIWKEPQNKFKWDWSLGRKATHLNDRFKFSSLMFGLCFFSPQSWARSLALVSRNIPCSLQTHSITEGLYSSLFRHLRRNCHKTGEFLMPLCSRPKSTSNKENSPSNSQSISSYDFYSLNNIPNLIT